MAADKGILDVPITSALLPRETGTSPVSSLGATVTPGPLAQTVEPANATADGFVKVKAWPAILKVWPKAADMGIFEVPTTRSDEARDRYPVDCIACGGW